MLVLKRKIDEMIHIGNDVVVTILKVDGKNVSVGIEAPLSTRILRHEILERYTDDNKTADKELPITPEA